MANTDKLHLDEEAETWMWWTHKRARQILMSEIQVTMTHICSCKNLSTSKLKFCSWIFNALDKRQMGIMVHLRRDREQGTWKKRVYIFILAWFGKWLQKPATMHHIIT